MAKHQAEGVSPASGVRELFGEAPIMALGVQLIEPVQFYTSGGNLLVDAYPLGQPAQPLVWLPEEGSWDSF